MRRRDFVELATAAAVWPLAARAQQKATPVIGLLHSLAADRTKPQIDAFREGLQQSGYIEGRNLTIEYRWADGYYDRLPELAADLVRRKVDVIATGGGTNPAIEAKKATSTIPIVLCLAADPVRTGLVESLARPGGNVTGVGILSLDLIAKRIDLTTELLPQAKVVVLLVNPNVPTWKAQVEDAQQATASKGLQLHGLKAGTKDEIDSVFASLSRLHVDALVMGADAFLYRQRDQLAALALRYAVPVMYELREHVDAGGLVSYGNSVPAAYRQAARIVGKILGGAKPADIPVALNPLPPPPKRSRADFHGEPDPRQQTSRFCLTSCVATGLLSAPTMGKVGNVGRHYRNALRRVAAGLPDRGRRGGICARCPAALSLRIERHRAFKATRRY